MIDSAAAVAKSVTKVRRHQQLPEVLAIEPGLDQHRVDHGERGGGQGDAGDGAGPAGPAQEPIGGGHGGQEGPDERDQPDAERRPPFPPQLVEVHLGPGQEGEHDRGEGRDEVEPRLALQPEEVAGDDPPRSSRMATDRASSTETMLASSTTTPSTVASASDPIEAPP